MSNQPRSASKQQQSGPTDPSEMLVYKRHFDRGRSRKTPPSGWGALGSVVEAVRDFVADWLIKAPILLHSLARRFSTTFFRGASRLNIFKKVLPVRRRQNAHRHKHLPGD